METLRQIQQFSVLFAPGVNKKAYDHAFLFGEIYERAEFLALILGCDAPIFRRNPPLFHLIRKEVDSCLNNGILDVRIVAEFPGPKRVRAARHIQMGGDFSIDRRFKDRIRDRLGYGVILPAGDHHQTAGIGAEIAHRFGLRGLF